MLTNQRFVHSILQYPFLKDLTRVKPNLKYLLLFALTFVLEFSFAQVFSDDFSQDTDPAWTTSGIINGSAWEVFRPNADWGARRNNSPEQLELTNDVGATANAIGYCLVTSPASDFPTPYNTVLSSGGTVSYTHLTLPTSDLV